jgi:hypothetical protein
MTPAAEAAAEPTLASEQVAADVPEPLRPPLIDPEVPAEVPDAPAPTSVEVPATVPEAVPPQRNNGSPWIGSRRPAAVTRQLAADMLDAEPGITRKEIAARLGLSTRRLREVLASAP